MSMDLVLFDDEEEIEEGLIRKKHINGMNNGDETLYVAVGRDVREYESLLLWAIQNSGGHSISILHVHQPPQFIPIMGKKYHWRSLEEQQVRKYREIEKQLVLKNLDEYIHICRQFGIPGDKLYIEMDSIEDGILQLIARNNIRKLIMGAAADDNCYTEMMKLKSKKAICLLDRAPASCELWFICKGQLIHQGEGHSQTRAYDEIERSANSKCIPLMDQSNICTARSQEIIVREGSAYVRSGPPSNMIRESRSITTPLELPMEPYSQQNHHQLSSPGHVAQAKAFENLYTEELRRSKELERENDNLKNDREKLREELRISREQNSELENKIANYDLVVRALEDGMNSSVSQFQICEKERDDLIIERDNVLKTAEELLNQSADAANVTDVPKFFSTLTFAEIEGATSDFDESIRLWGSESVSIYRGVLSRTQVTVKVYHPEGLEGLEEFHPEVSILSKFRHPNIVCLMGVCPEACALVYEYLPNGNLEERLQCKDNTPPLPWRTRIRIATELCCVLIFLHSDVVEKVVHGSLKPASVLLDSSFTCKITDFGFSHIIPRDENSVHTEHLCSSTYMDPQFFTTGQVSPAVDVFSFGMIVLELLTGKPAYGNIEDLQDALDADNFHLHLDALAGDWPSEQAEQLAKLALRCCAEDASDRPNLKSEAWLVLEPMRASLVDSPSHHIIDEERHQAPSHFLCPISQDVMEDPHIAADGHTYEAVAIRQWLETGHNTSPLTNLPLENLDLVPNRALRSAIQEWIEQHPTST